VKNRSKKKTKIPYLIFKLTNFQIFKFTQLLSLKNYIDILKPVRFSESYRFFIALILGLTLWQSDSFGKGVGPNEDYYLVHDYHDDWQVFDEKYKAYVPYVRERHQDYRSFSLFFDIENYKGYKILYYSKRENYLFIDASLQKKLPTDSWIILDVDSLEKVARKTNLFITFYGVNSSAEEIKFVVGNKIIKNKNAILDETDSLLSVRPRTLTDFDNFFIIILLSLIAMYGFLFNYQPKSFDRYYSFKDLLTINTRDDSFAVNKPFDFGNLLFIVNLSFTLGFLLIILKNVNENFNIYSLSSLFSEEDSLLAMFSNFIILSIIIFGVFMIKFISVSLISNLFRLDNITNIHFFKIIQSSSIFFLMLIVWIIFCYVSWKSFLQLDEIYLSITVIVFFLVRLSLIYYTINKMTSLKNLYLFSYLCIVEFIPIIVGIRYAL
jgi:hypothetical protein